MSAKPHDTITGSERVSDDCISRDEHCWHEIPIFYMGSDEPYEAVCCHCGSTHAAVTKPEIPLGHGPFYPTRMVDVLDSFGGPSAQEEQPG